MMGGNLWVESVEDEGSAFRFTVTYLPVTPENEHFFRMEADVKSPANRGMILMLEPETMKFRYVERFLAASGFVLRQAGGIPQGIDVIINSTRVDAMILNQSVLTQASNDEIEQFKSISIGLPMILIGDHPDEPYIQTGTKLEEPFNHEKLTGILETICCAKAREGAKE
jgi:hypothetical protein